MRGKQGETERMVCQESLERKGKREQESPGSRGSPETWDPRVNLGATDCLVWTGFLACKEIRGTEACQGKRWVVSVLN